MKKTGKILAIFMVLLMLVQVVMPLSAFAVKKKELTLGVLESFDFESSPEGNSLNYTYDFTPETTGRYNFAVVFPYEWADVYVWDFETGEQLAYSWSEDSARIGADLEAGKTYKFTVELWPEADGFCEILVTKAPAVTGVEIIANPFADDAILKDEINPEDTELGYWGLELKVTFDDGSFEEVDYNGDYTFANGYKVNVNTVLEDGADLGKTTVEVGGKTDTFKIDIIDNPVKKIEYVGKPISIIENTSGEFEEDGAGNEFFFYHVSEIYQDDVFKVTFTDGTTDLVSLFDAIVGSQSIGYTMNQQETHWKPGADNVISFNFGNVEYKLKIEIKPSNVKKITVISNPTTEYIFGSYDNGYMYDGGYNIYINELDGLKFEVTFKDGSKKIFTGDDADLNRGKLGDYYFAANTGAYTEKPGTVEVPFNFNGCEAKCKITVKPSNIKSLELVKAPTKSSVPDGFVTGYIGAEFKVTYTDGKTQTIKVTKENVGVMGDSSVVFVDDSNEILQIHFDNDDLKAFYGGVSCDVPEPTYTAMLNVVDIDVKNFGKSNMELILIFGDGTKETIKIDRVDTMGGMGGGPSDVEYDFYYTDTKYGLLEISTEVFKEAGLPVQNNLYACNHVFTEDINKNAKLSKIVIASNPTVVRYKKGEKFDPSGLVIKAIYDNGCEGEIYYDEELYEIEISAVDTSKEGTKTVKVKFEGKEATFTIEVGGSFKDVKKGAWYEQYVDYATKYGIFNGTGNGNFSPDAKLSRAQFVQVLANIEGVDLDNSIKTDFKDVASGKWYTGAVAWAAKNEIVSGSGDGKFNPNADVSREQMCVILVNFMEKYWHGEFNKEVIATTFADDAQISSWAKKSVYKAFRAGLVTGTGNNKFSPKLSATRSQGATIFTKFHDEYIAW